MKKVFYVLCLMAGTLFAVSCSGGSKGELKEFHGHVQKFSSSVMIMSDAQGRVITFDTREATMVGSIMPGDSVHVTYRGELTDGTPAIITEFIPKPPTQEQIDAISAKKKQAE